MLSGPLLKQNRTYLKSQVGNGLILEGSKSKGILLTRVSFTYLNGEREKTFHPFILKQTKNLLTIEFLI